MKVKIDYRSKLNWKVRWPHGCHGWCPRPRIEQSGFAASPGFDHCVVFMNETLLSQYLSLPMQVNK